MAPATKRMKHLRKLSQKAIINQEQDNMEEMEQFIILEDSEESDDVNERGIDRNRTEDQMC